MIDEVNEYNEANDTMKVILTDSKKYEIKRMIGWAFHLILKQIAFRKIIDRPPWYRTKQDNHRLFKELKKQ